MRIATFAPREIGDAVMATPLYRALRLRYPQARLSLITQRLDHPALEGLSVFDEQLADAPGLPLEGYDLIVLPVFCGDQAVEERFDAQPGALTLRGWLRARPRGLMSRLDGRWEHLLFDRHQVELNMELARAFGYEGQTPRLHRPAAEPGRYRRWRGHIGLAAQAPVTSFQARPNRQWPPGHWRRLVELLGERPKLLVGGPTDEPALRELAAATGLAVELAPSPGEFAALAAELDALVTGDGGSMHIAAAAGASIVSLHGTSSPILLHPWIEPDGRAVAVLSANGCSPCQRSYRLRLAELGMTRMDCMEKLSPAQAAAAVELVQRLRPGEVRLLQGGRVYTKPEYLADPRRRAMWLLRHNVSKAALKLRGLG